MATSQTYDFLIIGGGIFGLTTGIELVKKGYSTALINPGKIPHPDAASTDISKIVRMEYGTDVEYMEMVEKCIEMWREWNDLFSDTLFHEVGFMALCGENITAESRPFEYHSLQNLFKRGHKPERLNASEIEYRYPVFSKGKFVDGFFHALGGFAESGRTLTTLANYFQQLGGYVFENQTAVKIESSNYRVESVKTIEGNNYKAGHVIVCAGNSTPWLLPELKPFMKITGHPVFHLDPKNKSLYQAENLPVFAADISTTGWYGFPLHPQDKVVKIANHSEGLLLNPETDERIVYPEDREALDQFLGNYISPLQGQPIVFTRRCCYTDTLDGHFWIDKHPEIKGLSVGSGGSGHGFKMGPIIGKMIAAAALGEDFLYLDRHRWRTLDRATLQKEEARNLKRKQ